jgi:hypothetical protein
LRSRAQSRASKSPALQASAYVSIRQHTSAYVSIRQHTSAYVSIRQHTSASARASKSPALQARTASASASARSTGTSRTDALLRLHRSMRTHIYSIPAGANRERERAQHGHVTNRRSAEAVCDGSKDLGQEEPRAPTPHTSAYSSIRQHTSVC